MLITGQHSKHVAVQIIVLILLVIIIFQMIDQEENVVYGYSLLLYQSKKGSTISIRYNN